MQNCGTEIHFTAGRRNAIRSSAAGRGRRLPGLFFLGCLFLAGSLERGFCAYPTPAVVGFHHCVLIYFEPDGTKRDWRPFVVSGERERSGAWLFDAFLFLDQRAPSGRSLASGAAERTDWAALLNRWFGSNGSLGALDAAVTAASGRLGPPPSPRRVILGVPKPAGGDLDAAGRRLHWYVSEAVRRFQDRRFRHLSLWGFYWIPEGVPAADEALVRLAGREVHRAGCRWLWIPWFRAPGWKRWRTLGFDLAVLQPNYAFFSKHRGRVRRDRLAWAAALAAHHGMGIEIELPMAVQDPRAGFYFLRYLAAGAPGRFGYQAGVTAWYLGRDAWPRLSRSRTPRMQRMYAAAVRFLNGLPVADPDPEPVWKAGNRTLPGLTDGDWRRPVRGSATKAPAARFHRPQWVEAVDAAFPVKAVSSPAPPEWILVDVRPNPGAPWRPGGWALAANGRGADAPWRLLTVPVRRRAAAVRVRRLPAAGEAGSAMSALCELRIDGAPPAPDFQDHLARGRPYRIDPPFPAAYGDSGGELTDGVVPENGYAGGRTVGWFNQDVGLCFDLPAGSRIERAEVVVEAGGYAGIHRPRAPVLLLRNGPPLRPARTGLGPRPARTVLVPGKRLDRMRKHGPHAMTARIAFVPETPAPAESATFLLRARGWLMVSEVRLFQDGVNIARGRPYTVHPAPTPAPKIRYADDGMRLTDGRIARAFSPNELTGWNDGRSRRILIDLQSPRKLQAVTLWALGGGRFGIQAPRRVRIQTAPAQGRWEDCPAPRRQSFCAGRGEKNLGPVSYRVALDGRRARRLRVMVEPGPGWCMLSEVVVK